MPRGCIYLEAKVDDDNAMMSGVKTALTTSPELTQPQHVVNSNQVQTTSGSHVLIREIQYAARTDPKTQFLVLLYLKSLRHYA
jgi:hypothetical protein